MPNVGMRCGKWRGGTDIIDARGDGSADNPVRAVVFTQKKDITLQLVKHIIF
jgi:hypothetical protein